MNMPQPNLFSFAFVDPTMLFSTMTLKYGRHFEDDSAVAAPFHDCRRIVLRTETDTQNCADLPLMNEWPSARHLVGDVVAKTSELLGGENFQLGCVYIESLRPGGCIGWHADESSYAKAHQRFRLLVSPCSGGVWFSGNDSLAPGVGNLTYFNNRVLNSAINLGPVPQISLVLDLRRPALQ